MAWVLDASVTLCWCFIDELTPETNALRERLRDDPAIVPNLWPLEIANTLSLALRKKAARITGRERTQFLEFLQISPIEIDPHTTERAWGPTLLLADLYPLSIYDAAYLELAIRLGVELATLDADLRAAATAAGVTVIP